MIPNETPFPKVSILLAARNEEHNILRCLNALILLDYPKDQLEILVGNDASTDATGMLIDQFITEKQLDSSYIRVFSIIPSSIGLRGKTNVLAQLAREATGDYFFFCDADIAVPTTWIKGILSNFDEGVGSVIGVSRMRPLSLFADFQSIEWVSALHGMHLMSLFKIPSTGMGNNMAVSRAAYEATGGYEQVGFSIVEDYALYAAILDQGYNFRNAFHPDVLAVSEPVKRFDELIIQRKRWVQGAMQSRWLLRLIFLGTAILVPLLLLLALFCPQLALILGIGHYLFVTIGAAQALVKLKQTNLWLALPLFWFYFTTNTTLMLIIHYLPYKTVWKGRIYE
jgi:cellulose synthase/poly-beta-1,6-N-acetylglucosamine synthase-like glycosyltransferase